MKKITSILLFSICAIAHCQPFEGYQNKIDPIQNRFLILSPEPEKIMSSGYWNLSGNSGTDTSADFIGTTDATDLFFRINNQKAGRLDYANDNTFFGLHSGYTNTNGYKNTFIGAGSGYLSTSSHDNTGVGYYALASVTSGNQNAACGRYALANTSTGVGNAGLGMYAGQTNEDGTGITCVGFNSNVGSASLSNATAIGYGAVVSTSNSMVFGNGSVNVGIGTSSPAKNFHLNGTFRMTDGTQSNGYVLTCDGSGNGTWQMAGGGSTAAWNTRGNAGTVDGTDFFGTTDSTALNFRVLNSPCGRIDLPLDNSFWGLHSGFHNTTGYKNTFIGAAAGFSSTTSYQNTAVGYYAESSTTTGRENSALGYYALGYNTTGIANTGIGNYAGRDNETGTGITCVGFQANVGSSALENATAIGYGSTVSASNSMVLGNGSIHVGIGTSTPSVKAVLELTSTTNGFLPPRMTTTQRTSISSVPEGMIIYDLTLHQMAYYNGSTWVLF